MKKILVLLLALLLAYPALAEEASPFYLLTAADGTPVGTAVLCQDASTLLAAAHLTGQGELLAQGSGGPMAVTQVRTLGSSLALLTLDTPSPAAPLALNLEATPALAFGYDEKGQACISTLEQRSIIPYGDDFALTFTAQQAMLPGSILVDENGCLCGLCVASYGEGINRYVGIAGQMLAPIQYNAAWVTDFTATPGSGSVTVDWSACDMQCSREDCVMSVFAEDIQNPYFSYYAAKESTSASLLLAPGRTYRLWLQHAHGEPQPNMSLPGGSAQLVKLPSPERFTLYGFKTQDMHLSAVPAREAAEAENTYQPPMASISAAALLDPDSTIFMQVRSTYQVEEEQSAMLLASLVTPEGCCFTMEGLFLFEPTLQQQDDWNLNITNLLDACVSYCGQLAAGEYTLSFYLDGALGAEVTFTLE